MGIHGVVRRFAGLVALAIALPAALLAAARGIGAEFGVDDLPVGSHPTAIEAVHFPDRLHAFVWRNWLAVPTARLAEVVQATPEQLSDVARSMGLPGKPQDSQVMLRRGYITLLRRNWHLLPYEQLLTLLGLSAEELDERLREDDFLYVKLGRLKPKAPPLVYAPPDAKARARAAEIRREVLERFGPGWHANVAPRFAFVEQFAAAPPAATTADSVASATSTEVRDGANRDADAGAANDESLRLIYSYFGSYGDPLLDPQLDPYPDGLLDALRQVGVNGVWLHSVLRDLAPGGEAFPEFGQRHAERLRNLRTIVRRAGQHGIRVYLYVNEPRAMPPAFFSERPEMAGVREGEQVALCTSQPAVRDWMRTALQYVFEQVPGLGGVCAITASENLTSCASRYHREDCPRCRQRSDAEIISEVVRTISEGVHAGNPAARVIAWDWGWNRHGDASDLIARLPDDVELMSVSEWATPFERGGVSGRVGEYSISVVGPGPRARRHWQLARERGLPALAKVQLNNTWELSAVPNLPVMDLVAEHCRGLVESGVDGMMLSWTLGGYPSPNLELARQIFERPDADTEATLLRLAAERYGASAAGHVREAWRRFSRAFQQFPYDGNVLYRGPQNYGPANLLHQQPTGYRATMLGFPYDDLDGWRGAYPREVLGRQFALVAEGWEEGLEAMRRGLRAAAPGQRDVLQADLGLAEAAGLHFRSAANQARFIRLRDARAEQQDAAAAERITRQMLAVLDDEIDVARRLFELTVRDPRIGFEASNHYYYLPEDLVEKALNCLWLRGRLATGGEAERAGG